MKPATLVFVTVAMTLGATGCGDEPSRSTGIQVTDSSGVTIVDNGNLDRTRELLASGTPTLEIGSMDGEEEFLLHQVTGAVRLSNGGVAVTNGGTRELRIYDADGAHRATAGGSGEGPSEFGYPVGLRVLGDTIVVQDRLDRVYFDSDGSFLRRTSTDSRAMADVMTRAGGMSEGGVWMADGSFFAPIYQWDEHPPEAGPPFRPSMTFVRVSSDLSSLDTLGTFGGILQQYVDIGRDRPSATVPPFSTNTSWGVGGADGAIVGADNAVPQVEVFDPFVGRRLIRWAAESTPVSGAEVEAWKGEQREASWAQRRLPELERAWASVTIPTTKPFYGRGTTGSDGTVWLGPVAPDDVGWLVFHPDGEYLGIAGLSGRFTPMDSGDGWVLGVFRDDQEVEYVRVYALSSGVVP